MSISLTALRGPAALPERPPVRAAELLRRHRLGFALALAVETMLLVGLLALLSWLPAGDAPGGYWLAAGAGALGAAALAGLLLAALALWVLAREEALRHCAYYDRLTGLPNRRLFRDRLDRELRLAARAQRPLGLLFIDLDGFKAVNDSLGHDAGDDLLRQAAQRMQGCLRQVDTVARLGGDEFTVLLAGLSRAEDARRVAEQIVRALAVPFAIDGEPRRIGASVGIALSPRDGSDDDFLLRAADRAMYRAKRLGGNRCVNYADFAGGRRLRVAADRRAAP